MNDLRFNLAVMPVLEIEKEYSNDPDDPGGMTKWGISQRYNPEVDLKNLTFQGAIEVYRRKYWDKYNIGKIENLELAKKVFSMVVNINGRQVIKYLQMACNLLGADLEVDGILGPKSAKWINSYRHQLSLLAAFKYYIVDHYLTHSKVKFRAGLLKRAEI